MIDIHNRTLNDNNNNNKKKKKKKANIEYGVLQVLKLTMGRTSAGITKLLGQV